ncbi:MAG TPA: hypothetical protein VF787_18440 [Thermoanaerobaculia bacterium]
MTNRVASFFFIALAALSSFAQSSSISITADHLDPVAAGDTIHYVISVSTEGPDDAANATVTVNLPAETMYVSLNAPAGWSCTEPAPNASGGVVTCTIATFTPGTAIFAIDATTSPSLPPQTITGTATVSSSTADPESSDNEATIDVVIIQQADLAAGIDAPANVTAGQPLDVTITVTNNGPSTSDASFSYTLPAELTFDSLDAPAGWSCSTPAPATNGTVSCSIAALDPGVATFNVHTHVILTTESGTITHTVTVSGSTDTIAPNDTASDTTNITEVPRVSLSVAITDSPDPAQPGGTVTYTVTATNAGPDAAPNASIAFSGGTFTITPPGGWSCTPTTCTTPSFAANTSAVFTVTKPVPTTPGGSTSLTATITSDGLEQAPGDETDTESTTIGPGAALSGTKSASGGNLAGSPVTFTIVVTNNGGAPQGNNPGDELEDVLPAGLTLISASATSGTALADIPNNRVTWNGALAIGASVTITIEAVVDAQPSAPINNSATIRYDSNGDGTNDATTTTNTISLAATAAIPLASHEVLLLVAILLAALGVTRLRLM